MLRKILNCFIQARRNQAARRDINRLTDRDLRDIGMTRSDLLFMIKN